MTTKDTNFNETNKTDFKEPFYQKQTRGGRMLAGLIVVIAGAALLLKNSGILMPSWLFSWQMFLIVLGLFIGAKNSFKTGGWWIVSLVGVVFLFEGMIFNISIRHLFWPVIIIGIGLMMIFKPKKKWHRHHKNAWHQKWEEKYSKYQDISDENDNIDSTIIFGNTKKKILSKNFKGGDITCIFGGVEINLMQADINGRVMLEITQIFGGTKLLVPAHWEVVQTEMVSIFGGIEDKRPQSLDKYFDGVKTLVIVGTSIFGGIDIKSY